MNSVMLLRQTVVVAIMVVEIKKDMPLDLVLVAVVVMVVLLRIMRIVEQV